MRDIAVTVLTGFLGSGKTTLLNRLLMRPEMANTAIIINELGDVGIDDVLISRRSADAVLLNSGCLCCSVKDNLTSTLQELIFQALRGEIPAFQRVVIETTGLADPGPILQVLMQDPMLTGYYRTGGVITTVDAVHGARTLDEHVEAVHQAAIADRLLVTKADLATEDTLDALSQRLEDLNPGAQRFVVTDGAIEPELLFNTGLFDPKTKTADVQRWLNLDAFAARERQRAGESQSLHHLHHDHHGIQSYALIRDEPLAWEVFSRWIEAMTLRCGRDMLRIKGIIHIREQPETPWVVHGVQDVFHPPARLPEWPTADRRTRIVFITRGVSKNVVEETLRLFEGQAGAVRAGTIHAIH